MQVANHEQLHATKRIIDASQLPQHHIYPVQRIGAYHTDLVNDQEIQAFDDGQFFSIHSNGGWFAIQGIIWNVRAKGKLEEGVKCYTAGIDGGDASRCCDHEPFGWIFLNSAQ